MAYIFNHTRSFNYYVLRARSERIPWVGPLLLSSPPKAGIYFVLFCFALSCFVLFCCTREASELLEVGIF